jgi:type II secretory pathway component PulM
MNTKSGGTPTPSTEPGRLGRLLLLCAGLAVLLIVAWDTLVQHPVPQSSRERETVAPETSEPKAAVSTFERECQTSDIDIVDFRADTAGPGMTRIVGRLVNNCAQATGAEIKIVIYDKDDNILRVEDMWPASINNIPAHADYPFEWLEEIEVSSSLRFSVRVIEVKRWQRRSRADGKLWR